MKKIIFFIELFVVQDLRFLAGSLLSQPIFRSQDLFLFSIIFVR
jgi:hypothetical protein